MKQLSLRLDDDLYAELAKLAKQEDRSVNNMIVIAIKKLVKDNG